MSPIISARGGLSSAAYGQFALAADGGTSYQSIATVTVGSGGSATITFGSIPSTYKHLQVRAIAYASSAGNMQGQFNSDTGSNYARHYMYGDGASTAAGADANISYVNFGYVPSSSNYFSAVVTDILDYTSTSKNKTVRTLTGYDANGSGLMILYSGLWFATPAAITSITITPQSGTFSQYSHFALYGIKD
jgi:hypothetical protein